MSVRTRTAWSFVTLAHKKRGKLVFCKSLLCCLPSLRSWTWPIADAWVQLRGMPPSDARRICNGMPRCRWTRKDRMASQQRSAD